MYSGVRDPMLRVIVPSKICHMWIDSQDNKWVEIECPMYNGTNIDDYYYSFMVKESQVFAINECYNEVHINSGAYISVVQRTFTSDGIRQALGEYPLWSESIFSRYLYYLKCGESINVYDIKSEEFFINLYADFLQSKMTVFGYVGY